MGEKHPDDAGLTVEDFKWIPRVIVRVKWLSAIIHEGDAEAIRVGIPIARLTLERKELIIRQLCSNTGKILWENVRPAGWHQPL